MIFNTLMQQRPVRRVGVALTAAALLGALTARGEVGFAMRGNPQPFNNWDSAFNSSSSREHFEDGILLKLGALRLRPHLGVWAGEIDNVYLEAEDGITDTYVTYAPGVMLTYGHEEDDYLTLNYAYERTDYSEEDPLDYDSHLLSAGIHLLPGKFEIHLSDQFSDTTDENLELAQRTSKLQNVETLRVRMDSSRKTALELEQRYEIHDYQDDELLDFDEYALGGRGYHQTFPKVRTFVDAIFGRVVMDSADVIGDADYVEIGVGLQGRLTAKTTLHGRAGWHNREFEDEIATIETWHATAGLTSRLSNRTHWGVDVARRLTPSSQRQGVTRETTAVMPSIRHILWRDRLAFALRGAYEWADYYERDGGSDREDEYWYVTAVLDWHPAQPFTVGVGYTHAEQESNERAAEHEQNHLFIRAMLNY